MTGGGPTGAAKAQTQNMPLAVCRRDFRVYGEGPVIPSRMIGPSICVSRALRPPGVRSPNCSECQYETRSATQSNEKSRAVEAATETMRTRKLASLRLALVQTRPQGSVGPPTI